MLAGFACERLRFFLPVVRKITDFVALLGEDQRSPSERPATRSHGHAFGAKSIPWSTAAASERTFESVEKLPTNHLEDVDLERPMITYTRIPGMHQIVE
jgi:hypothetical protein